MEAREQGSFDIIERVLQDGSIDSRVRRIKIDLVNLKSIFDGFGYDEAITGVGQESLHNSGHIRRELIPLHKAWIEAVEDQNLFELGGI